MKALLYGDWCAVRSTLVRTLIFVPLVVVPLMVMANEGGSEAVGVMAATMTVMMVAFYILLAIFSADEQGDWEQVRLSLPVTARDVVRARYAFIALAAFGTALVGMAIGIVANLALSLLKLSSASGTVLSVVAASLSTAAAALAYLSLLMPVIFKMGLSKARIFFSLPFFLIMLLNVKPVADAFRGVIGKVELATNAMGSPIPLLLAGIAVAAAIYLGSLLISERLYSARDF